MQRYIGILGILVLLLIAFLLSSNRRRISLRVVICGLGLQFGLAILLLAFPPAVKVFDKVAQLVQSVIACADPGSEFIFGKLATTDGPWGTLFAFHVLPIIIFFASLMAILYHAGIMQRVIAVLAWCLRRSLGITGSEAMAMAANVFIGQTEAPLCVKPLIPRMTQSQLATLMVGGFATIAGSVLGAYVGMLGGDDPATRVLFAKHLITASVMSAPAAIVIAKIMVPETETPPIEQVSELTLQRDTRNILDAAAVGATDGLKLALNVAAMLVAFVALLALVNYPLEALSEWKPVADWRIECGIPPLSLQQLLGWLFKPLAWIMSIPWEECTSFGTLLGEKLIATEFVAYSSLTRIMHGSDPQLSARSAQIAAYALCGFANFPSIAIQIGGLSGIAPSRRADFATLGLKTMLGGAMASWMTACIASLFMAE
ncbi:MAG: nucleoside transporter C-terminal domain-containing protein [Planctomycetota bacterium]